MTVERLSFPPSSVDLPLQTRFTSEGSTQETVFAQFVGGSPVSGEVDPLLSTEKELVPFMTDSGELTGSPEELINYDDVEQDGGTILGDAGDCYFMGALAALAEARPEVILDNLSHDGDSYTVTFYRKDGDQFVPEQVTVSDAEVEENALAGFGDYLDDGDVYRIEQWARIYEAAYVKWKGGPENVYEGGSSLRAMEILTGYESESPSIQIDYLSPEQWKENLERGDLITLETTSGPAPGWHDWMPWTWGSNGDELFENGALDYRHVYLLKDIKDPEGQAMVELVDPRFPDETIVIPYHELTMAYRRGGDMAVNMLGR